MYPKQPFFDLFSSLFGFSTTNSLSQNTQNAKFLLYCLKSAFEFPILIVKVCPDLSTLPRPIICSPSPGATRFSLYSTVNTAAPPLQITPDKHLTDSTFDAILLPGMWIKSLSALQNALASHQAIIDALGQLNQNTHIYSYCTAVSLVAKAGQLKACEATSTWWLADYFKSARILGY